MDRERIIRKLKSCSLKPEGSKRTYKVLEKLGQGGNGVTFVVQESHKELVAKFYVPPNSRDLDNNAFKRFQREIELSSRTRHPFLVPVEGTGSIAIGAYSFPYYLMPRAKGTLRQLIPSALDLSTLAKRLRTFTQVVNGVSYLHHIGIFHRDLKPENVLIFSDNIPKVADLGIAHVAPDFVEWTKLTLPKDELMNRDYYAPEQRGADATKVDHRVDIYALGLIFYEIISGISPSRPSLPSISSLDKRLANLDKIFKKMTEFDRLKRYQNLDIILDELTWTLISLGIPTEAPSSAEEDKLKLVKFIRSSNAMKQARALEISQRLGEKALPELHEMAGDRRVDVALTSLKFIGNLAHKASLPHLAAGLYPRRTSQKPRFITGEAAAEALRNYSTDDRLEILKGIKDIVLASHIAKVIEGIPPEKSFPSILRIFKSKLFYEEWSHQSGLSFLLQLDQDKSWSIVEELLSKSENVYSFTIFRDIYPFVSVQRKMLLIDYLLDRESSLSSWELSRILENMSRSNLSIDYELLKINKLEEIAPLRINKWGDREAFMKNLAQEKRRILK